MTDTFIETHNNGANDWLGEFRTGNFDIVALSYALSINKDIKEVDGLVISYLDVLRERNEWQVCEAYEYQGKADDLEDYFYLDGKNIVGIKLHPDTQDEAQYKHQLRLTQLLKDCRSVLTTLTPLPGQTMEETFISYVQDRLGVPVVGKAYGPAPADRLFLPSFDEIVKSHR
jgi:adenylosuccinate synthase